jgi:hypothetical protein
MINHSHESVKLQNQNRLFYSSIVSGSKRNEKAMSNTYLSIWSIRWRCERGGIESSTRHRVYFLNIDGRFETFWIANRGVPVGEDCSLSRYWRCKKLRYDAWTNKSRCFIHVCIGPRERPISGSPTTETRLIQRGKEVLDLESQMYKLNLINAPLFQLFPKRR